MTESESDRLAMRFHSAAFFDLREHNPEEEKRTQELRDSILRGHDRPPVKNIFDLD